MSVGDQSAAVGEQFGEVLGHGTADTVEDHMDAPLAGMAADLPLPVVVACRDHGLGGVQRPHLLGTGGAAHEVDQLQVVPDRGCADQPADGRAGGGLKNRTRLPAQGLLYCAIQHAQRQRVDQH